MVKDLIRDISVDLAFKGLQSLHLIHWLLRGACCADRGSLLHSVRKVAWLPQASEVKVYQQCWKEWEGRMVYSEVCLEQCHL